MPEENQENEGKIKVEVKTEESEKETKSRSPWMYSTIILAIAVIAMFGMQVSGMFAVPVTGNIIAQDQINSQDAGQKAIDFINENLVQPGTAVSLSGVTEMSGVYNVTTSYAGSEIPVYMTKDGRYLIVPGIGAIDIDNFEAPESQEPEPSETPKSDRPVMDVFIMSYCPYGLQMQKAVLPVMELLGDKAEINIKWVSYAMHEKKEIDENTRQYCIQLEQDDKYIAYADCFTASGDFDSCLAEAGIDTSALDSCMAEADEEFRITELYEDKSTWTGSTCPDLPYCFPLYMVDAEENDMFGVGGSPTVVLNGKVISVIRSPESVKQELCNAFNTMPEECSQTLSTDKASSGFGSDAGTGGSGTCG